MATRRLSRIAEQFVAAPTESATVATATELPRPPVESYLPGEAQQRAQAGERLVPHAAAGHWELGEMPDSQQRTTDIGPSSSERPWVTPGYERTRWKSDVLYPELCALGLAGKIADLHVKGYCVVEPALFCPPEYVEQLQAALLRCSERRSHGIVPDVADGSSHAGMNGPLGQHMRYILWEEKEAFEPWLTNPALLGLVYYMLGPDVILSLFDGMVKGPGGNATGLHGDNGAKADLVYPTDWGYGVTVNMALSTYGDEEGGLGFVPGSHLLRREPTAGETAAMQAAGECVPVRCEAGSLIIWPNNTWHVAYPRKVPGLRLTLGPILFVKPELQTQSDFKQAAMLEQSDSLDRNPAQFTKLMDANATFPFRAQDFDFSKFVGSTKVGEKAGNGALGRDALPMWKEFFADRQPDPHTG